MIIVIDMIKMLSLVLLIFLMAVIDLRIKKIPNCLILTALLIRCFIYPAEFLVSPASAVMVLKDNLLGAFLVGGFFLLFLFVFKRGIGMGDVKLFTVIALYQGVWGAVYSVFFSFVVFSLLSMILLITKKKKCKDEIPMGPSILAGTVIAMGLSGIYF